MEQECSDDGEAKDENLNEETGNDGFLLHIVDLECSRRLIASTSASESNAITFPMMEILVTHLIGIRGMCSVPSARIRRPRMT